MKKLPMRPTSRIEGSLPLMTNMIRLWNKWDEYYMLNEWDEQIWYS